MESAVFILVRGLSHALTALGFALVFGAGRVLNLSHGALYLVAAYLLYGLAGIEGMHGQVPLAVVLAVVLTGALGGALFHLVLRQTAYRPNRTMVLCLGVNLVIAEGLRTSFGTRGVLVPPLLPGSLEIFGVLLARQHLLVVGGGVVVLLLTGLMLRHTRVGRAVRAVAQDREAAETLGIEAAPVLGATFAASAALAGLAACLITPLGVVAPSGWITPLVKSFAVVVLGGTTVGGLVVAAFVLATAEVLTGAWISEGAAEYVGLLVILIVLVARPRGILGAPG